MSARIDAHVHVLGAGAEGARQLARIERDYAYETANFLSVEGMNDAAQNALGIYFKLLDPSHYAFGGFHYRFAYDFAAELESLHAIGFDGIKMIENKPTERRRLDFRQDDPRGKPFSLQAEFGLLSETLAEARKGRQLQPVLL